MEINKVYLGDSVEILKGFPDECVDCVVTSPPYYGLRDYGTGTWVGGDPNCNHYRDTKKSEKTATGHKHMQDVGEAVGDAIYKTVCPKCGAVRVDKQIGLEDTPEAYIERLVSLFREVKRVLKKDGTCWVNLGDSYCGTGDKGDYKDPKYKDGRNGQSVAKNRSLEGYKAKDLIGIPWMFAFAMRADGWYLRQDIIWAKPNPMPESVTDRCVKSHEYIFLFSKSKKYWFDHEAIQEEASVQELNGEPKFGGNKYGANDDGHYATYSGKEYKPRTKNCMEDGQRPNSMHIRREKGLPDKEYVVRNKRDVWTVNVQPTKEAHFATYPQKLVTPCILAGCRRGGG